MALGPNSNVLTSGYQPAYGSEICYIKVSVTNVETRLASLITTAGGTMPSYTNPLYDLSNNNPGTSLQPPWHVYFQVDPAAANVVWATWDNNTAPVVGGPGIAFLQGVVYRFENAGNSLLRPKSAGIFQVNSSTAFRFIATGATAMNVGFAN